MRELEEAVRTHKRDVMLPWPQIGVYVVPKYIRKLPGGNTDELTLSMRKYFMYEKAATAARAYNEWNYTDLVFLKNVPDRWYIVGKVPKTAKKKASNKNKQTEVISDSEDEVAEPKVRY
ncbi:unnamed protein product [Clonostachys byssicola]|uniref:Uncharacterized protein n=1 Tax=Clonostachys byssicola TaxID=160290 RepID=A0A9N9YAK3_9HYPO|nr:unnamed protein product [Clonostachys byssicola]